MDIIEDIKAFLRRDDPPARTQSDRREAAKTHIEVWLQAQSVTQHKLEPVEFAERLRALVDAPQMLRQGAYPWCLPAAFLQPVLQRFPDEVVRFGLDLYENGAASLGDISVTMSDAFRAFDYAATINSIEIIPPRSRDLYLAAHADWLLLAGVQEDTTRFYTVSGSLRDPVSFLSSTLVDLFEDCGFYEDVTDMSSADKNNRQKLVEALDKSGTHDVLLVGDMTSFGVDGQGRHAVRLIAPPVITANGTGRTPADAETLTFQFWSWGFQPFDASGLPFDAAKNAFTRALTRRQFAALDIIVAEPKPI